MSGLFHVWYHHMPAWWGGSVNTCIWNMNRKWVLSFMYDIATCLHDGVGFTSASTRPGVVQTSVNHTTWMEFWLLFSSGPWPCCILLQTLWLEFDWRSVGECVISQSVIHDHYLLIYDESNTHPSKSAGEKLWKYLCDLVDQGLYFIKGT